ncbi:MAG: hypothetical protein SGPRY_004887 [Prymnesium sp.]
MSGFRLTISVVQVEIWAFYTDASCTDKHEVVPSAVSSTSYFSTCGPGCVRTGQNVRWLALGLDSACGCDFFYDPVDACDDEFQEDNPDCWLSVTFDPPQVVILPIGSNEWTTADVAFPPPFTPPSPPWQPLPPSPPAPPLLPPLPPFAPNSGVVSSVAELQAALLEPSVSHVWLLASASAYMLNSALRIDRNITITGVGDGLSSHQVALEGRSVAKPLILVSEHCTLSLNNVDLNNDFDFGASLIFVNVGRHVELLHCRIQGEGYTAITVDGGVLQLYDCVFSHSSPDMSNVALDGGAVYLRNGPPIPITFQECLFLQNEALRRGGAVILEGEEHSGCETEVSFDRCNFVENLAVDGGALYINRPLMSLWRSTCARVVLSATQIVGNVASHFGGGVFVASGSLGLANATLLRSNRAQKASLFFTRAGTIMYYLPAPIAHWLPGVECHVNRRPCGAHDSGCEARFDKCKFILPGTLQASNCSEAFSQQVCDYDTFPDAIGQLVYSVSYGSSIEGDVFPFPCAPGLYGSMAPRDQLTAVCAGRCPAGKLCPTEATREPLKCRRGAYCPEGSATYISCVSRQNETNDHPAGRYSNASNIAAPSQCMVCPPGSACLAGSEIAVECQPGSFTSRPGEERHVLLTGKSQIHLGLGRINAMAVASMNITIVWPVQTSEFSQRVAPQGGQLLQCAWHYQRCRLQSDVTRLLLSNRQRHADAVRPWHSLEGATSCEACPPASFCDVAGLAASKLCPAGTFSNMTGLSSEAQCLDVQPGYYAPLGSREQVACPRWGFCAGRALDVLNEVPGSIPVPVPDGQVVQMVEEEERLTSERQVARQLIQVASANTTNEIALRVALASLYGVPAAAVSLSREDAGAARRRLASPITFVVWIDLSYLPNASSNYTEVLETLGTVWAARRPKLTDEVGYEVESVAPVVIETLEDNSTRIIQRRKIVTCPLGFWGADGRCVPCFPGFYGDVSSISECTPCPSGSYQPALNATECRDCEPGYWCPGATANAEACPAGTYSNGSRLVSSDQCRQCPAGAGVLSAPEWASLEPHPDPKRHRSAPSCSSASLSPTPCDPGSYAISAGSSQCTVCEAGRHAASSGAVSCSTCPLGWYCPRGATNPIGCEGGAGYAFAETKREGATRPEDCVCKAGYYNTTLGNSSCEVCPSGTSCDAPGSTLATLPVKRGYFRLSNTSIVVRRCPDAAVNCVDELECPRTTSGCKGTLLLEEATASLGCHSGLKGPYCLKCIRESGQRVYYSAATPSHLAQCRECRDAELHLFLVILLALLTACAIVLLAVRLDRRLSEAHRLQLRLAWRRFTPHVKLKILAGFYLIVSVIDRVYEVELPPEVRRLLDVSFTVVTFGLNAVDGLLECLRLQSYTERLAAYMLTPPLITVVIVLLSAAYLRYFRGRHAFTRAELVECSAPYLLLLLFLTYPLITRVAFDGFSCYIFKENESTASAWLKTDVNIKCHTSPEHSSAQALAIVAIILYPVGLMLLTGTFLYRARAAIRSQKPTFLSKAIDFLHREYEPHLYWWELVETLRRFVLVGLMVLFQDSIMQLIVATILSAIFLLLQVQVSPYRQREDDLLASVSSFCLVVVFLCATAYKYLSLTNLDDIQNKMSNEQRELYVVDGNVLLVILVFSSLGSIACFVGIFGVKLAAARVKMLDESELAFLKKEALSKSFSSLRVRMPKLVKGGSCSLSRLVELRRLASKDHGMKALHSGRITSADKFTTTTLITGKPEEAAFGLMHYMGVHDPFGLAAQGVERICAEIKHFVEAVFKLDDASPEMASLKTFARIESVAKAADVHKRIGDDVLAWLDYVLKEPASEKECFNGVRDAGRGPVRFNDFVKHEIALQAQLDPAHVLALRLYTTHAFKYMNGPLRSTEYGQGKRPHPLPITMTFISEGIKKLRAAYVASENATKVAHLWRGMKNLKVADEFLANLRGGTEVAPMSTTSNFRVATKNGMSDDSLLFKIKASSFLQYGAELQWLSAFPGEAEVCYPPLTYLQPTGRLQLVKAGGKRFTVCEVVPHIP